MGNLNEMLFDSRGDHLISLADGPYQMSEGLKQAADETKLKIREAFRITGKKQVHVKASRKPRSMITAAS